MEDRISGIPLLSAADAEPILSDRRDSVTVAASGPWYVFANADGSQILTLKANMGDQYTIRTVTVTRPRPGMAPAAFPGNPQDFVTGNGIHVGMTRQEVEAVLGDPSYWIGDVAAYQIRRPAPALQALDMEEYSALYAYEDDRLISFEFGYYR